MPPPLEIERVYLLRGLPEIPRGAEIWRIEQGYLPRKIEESEFGGGQRPARSDEGESDDGDISEGRIRRVIFPDGRVSHVHTLKRGTGLVRQEIEQPITQAQFQRLWPRTQGAQLRKTRHRVAVDHLVWEIDQFEDFDLVLAEVELPAADAQVTPPPWLRPLIEREVTEEPEYRNSAIARRMGLTVTLRRPIEDRSKSGM